jgi:sigma-B regulation protein RsbU (phosphoserine phosphatase)
LTLTNRILSEDMEDDRFCTMFLGCIDCSSNVFVYAGAGHEAYLVEPNGEIRRLPSTSMPLGMDQNLVVPCADPIPFESNQLILLLTDGITEAHSPHGESFGLKRANEIVCANRNNPARDIVETLCDKIRNFTVADPHDDVTVVVLKVEH